MEKRILIIDDDQQIRHLIGEILTRKGYVVDEAEDGQVGLDCIKQTNFDLIISDLQMPRMNGPQFLSMVVTLKPDTKVIIMSGNCTEETLMELLEKGAFDFIAKPFCLREFEIKVENILTKPLTVFQKV